MRTINPAKDLNVQIYPVIRDQIETLLINEGLDYEFRNFSTGIMLLVVFDCSAEKAFFLGGAIQSLYDAAKN